MEQSSSPQLSRRRALTVAGGVAAGAAIGPAAAPAFGAAAASDADAIVVGRGLAGLVATSELVAAGRKVLLLDQEPEASLGGQAFWSFGGLFFVDSVEQRLMGVKDSHDLAWQDWLGTAGFDRGIDDPAGQDYWAYKWAKAYVEFAAGEKRSWLAGLGMQWFPMVGWAERGGGLADGHGNSVPRFHVTWGTGPAVMEPFEKKVRAGVAAGKVVFKFRHRVDEVVSTGGAVTGVRGAVLRRAAPPGAHRVPVRWSAILNCTPRGDRDLRRHRRQPRPDPAELAGPARHRPEVHGHRRARARGRPDARDHRAGRRPDRQPRPDVALHRGPAQLRTDLARPRHPDPARPVLDVVRRHRQTLHGPGLPGYDTLHTLGSITKTGYDYSWFVTTQKIVDKEFALSGSEQNPDLTNKNIWLLLSRIWQTPEPIEKFMKYGEDFVVASTLPELVAGMNRLTGTSLIDLTDLKRQIDARDREMDNTYSKDAQVMGIRNAPPTSATR
jgi:predicted oxidoreductase